MERIHQLDGERGELLLDLDEIARAGARKMLAQALQAEVEVYLQAAKGERDGHGHALVVRNGYATEREVLLGAGSVEVRAPRVNDRRVDDDGQRRRFKSVFLPPYSCVALRRSQRSCRSFICTGSQAEISCLPSRSSSAAKQGFRRLA